MWPFTSSNDRDTSELTNQLPNNLKEFFDEVNPEQNHESIFEVSPQQARVNEVLLRTEKANHGKYDDVLSKYKLTEKPKKVCSINCSEINQQVMTCFKNFNYASFETPCTKEIKATTTCIELQKKALKKLHYDQCISIKQCDQIRYVIDKLFTENFGQYGDNVNEETSHKFNNDLDKVFWKVWR
ncbi:uncharacterized protein RJT21DRAFT_111234 [Scheffersomyces amazonensis]|uniref:uncharacterized protein n=1 Tax=Scheffersomyces amazonensis TaxID=1078765 RepID=UPI00315CA3DC